MNLQSHSPRIAVLLMCAAAACFVVSNGLVKHIGQWLPSGQLLCIRGAIASLVVLAVAHASHATRQLPAVLSPPVLVRAAVEAAGSTLFLASLAWLPLANATAIDMSAPLILTGLAVLFLGERVSAGRWLAMALGFVGVLLIVQPQPAAFDGGAVLCLAGAVLHAVRDLLTRRIPAGVPSVLVTLSAAIALTLVAGTWSLAEGWRPIAWSDLGWLALAAAFLSGGLLCVVASLRRGALSAVAPFRYVALPLALAAGFVVWGDVPGPLAWVGIALIAGSGLWVLRSAQRAHRVSVGDARPNAARNTQPAGGPAGAAP